MDYLLRDSLMTGAKYGIYDLEWIIKSLEIDEENDRLYVSARGIYAVEDYLQARYYMFRQVYFHRTLRSAENILRSLFAPRSAAFSKRKAMFGTRAERRLKNFERRKINLCANISNWTIRT
jgi:HD superfamily phosphohydrolase